MTQGQMRQLLADFESLCEQNALLLRGLLNKVVPGQDR